MKSNSMHSRRLKRRSRRLQIDLAVRAGVMALAIGAVLYDRAYEALLHASLAEVASITSQKSAVTVMANQ